MRPNNGNVRVSLEEGFYLVEICGFGSVLCKRNVDVVVEQHNQANFRSKIQYAIESRVLKACDFARNLRRYEFFVNRELAYTSKHAWEGLQHPAYVVRSIHVRRVEAGDHGIKPGLLFLRQRPICHR